MDLVCSWSGGKDSTLALDLAIEEGGRPRALLTMLTEDGKRSRSHGLPITVLAAQAEALGIDLTTQGTSWAAYTGTFVHELGRLRGHNATACCLATSISTITVAGVRTPASRQVFAPSIHSGSVLAVGC